jgi:ectoine hydroxylase-related dioxygenase (phytanoyl-CoA dioxygenase family)
MEFARGSHLWGASAPIGQFHNPADYKADFTRAAAAAGVADPEMVPVAVPAGGGSIHHGWLWHGSGPNRTGNPRRSVVSHCLSSEARFTAEVGYVYSRYKRLGTDDMDEAFFPVLWGAGGARSPFIDPFVDGRLPWHAAG